MENNKAEVFADYLLNGDEFGALAYLKDQKMTSLMIYENVITKAMQHIGLLWQNNEISVADEHLATGVCDFVLSQYAFPFKQKANAQPTNKIMFLCLENEQHMLGTKIAAALCEENNWSVRILGADLPLEYAILSAEKWKPDVIGLSAALPYRLPLLANYIDALSEVAHKPQIMIGGRLASHYDLESYCHKDTLIFKNLLQLNSWLESASAGVNINGIN